MVFKYAVYPESAKVTVRLFYERLMTYFSNGPLLGIVSQNKENTYFRPVPHSGDRSFVHCIIESIYYILRRAGLSSHEADLIPILISWNAIRHAKNDVLVKRSALSIGEVDILRIAAQHLAAQGGMHSQKALDTPVVARRVASMLESVEQLDELLDVIERNIGNSSGSHISVARFQLAQDAPLRGICSWLWFGRLRRDVGVDDLAGDPQLAQILRPVELTLVPDRVSNFADVGLALRHALNLCVLLTNQRTQIRNSFTLRICLIEHLFVRVLPLPLPLEHVHRKKRCFWHSQPMRYETQADILRLINMLCRHFSAASLSVKVTRSGDAIRVLTLACMAAICDAVLRKTASDIPSQSSLHYSGAAAGPVQPFGFDVGHFRYESEYLQFSSPETSVARTQVLDYFAEINAVVPEDHIMFRFEKGNACGSAEKKFIDQLCIQVGFPRGRALEYITGEDTSVLDHYPEIGFFRDLVFMFKLMMVPSSESLPELKPWGPSDAALRWSSAEGSYKVSGFGMKLECINTVVYDEDQQVAAGGILSALKKMIGIVGEKPRAPPSKANPSILVGERVDTEDDILHIRVLPDFDGTLGARDCELMLQYLTAPYLRIPLLLNFFSHEIRMKSLRCRELQEVLDAALFEPGRWQEEVTLDPPEMVPAASRKHISTPVGLLFNELVMSPKTILASMQRMLEQVVDMDSGKYSESSETILYVLRLAVRIEGYVKFLVKNDAFHKTSRMSSGGGTTGAYYESMVRGLEADDDLVKEAKSCVSELNSVLTTKMLKIIIRWIKKAKQEGKMLLACKLHAHIIYIYRNIQTEQLDAKIVFAILGSQIFIFNNYKYDIDVTDLPFADSSKKVERKDEDVIKHELGIPVIELFDTFQRNRNKIFEWLKSSAEGRNQVTSCQLFVFWHLLMCLFLGDGCCCPADKGVRPGLLWGTRQSCCSEPQLGGHRAHWLRREIHPRGGKPLHAEGG